MTERIRMPSGTGGLVRYFDEYKSRIRIQPQHIIVLIIILILVIIVLHIFGPRVFGF